MQGESGFTLLEMVTAMGIFLFIGAAMFGLLQVSQQKYSSESQISGSFQEARLALDQIVRDFNSSGYPPVTVFSVPPATSASYARGPLAWSPSYPTTPCSIGTGGGGTCTTPGDFDLIIETDLGSGVNWIRYQLQNGVLYRSVAPKVDGADPVAATSTTDVKVPFLLNVLNNPTSAQLNDIAANYPAMFPGGQPVPIFQFTCDTPTGPIACQNAGPQNSPLHVSDVDVTLIVMTPQRDLQRQRLNLVELNGRGHRVNPGSAK